MTKEKAPGDQPPTISISWTAIGIGLGALVIWYLGLRWLAPLGGFDAGCVADFTNRKASLAEFFTCGVLAGPKGWVYLGWLSLPVVAVYFALRTALRRAKKRRDIQKSDEKNSISDEK